MANGKPNRPIRPRGGGPKGRRRVVIDGGGGRPGQGQRQRPGDRPADRGPRQPREVVAPTGPVTVESGVTLRDFSQALGVAMPQIIKLLMNLGHDEDGDAVAHRRRGAADRGRARARGDDQARRRRRRRAGGLRGRRGDARGAPAGRHDHGSRRPRQDDAARRDPQDARRRDRGRRHHAAHRRLPGRPRRPPDHLPRHAGPRGVHRHARPRREGDRHRRARRRGRRRRDAADARSRSRTRARPTCRSSSPSTRSTFPTRTPTACSAELATEGLQPEEWGGDVQVARVSAKQGENLDDLLERILLVADAELDLRANPSAEASGPIIESRLDVGRGPVATMLDPSRHAQGRRRDRRRRCLGPCARALRLSRRADPGGAPGRARRDPRLRPAAACRRARPRRRERAPRARPRAAARRAPAPRGDGEAAQRRRLARQALRADAGRAASRT